MSEFVLAIRDMSEKNDQILLKLDYPTSAGEKGTSFPRVILKKVSDQHDDFILGTTEDDNEVIINPNKIVSAEPYRTSSPRITNI